MMLKRFDASVVSIAFFVYNMRVTPVICTLMSMLICIINKRQIGEMMKILKDRPDTFACFQKVNEVFGNFKRKV